MVSLIVGTCIFLENWKYRITSIHWSEKTTTVTLEYSVSWPKASHRYKEHWKYAYVAKYAKPIQCPKELE